MRRSRRPSTSSWASLGEQRLAAVGARLLWDGVKGAASPTVGCLPRTLRRRQRNFINVLLYWNLLKMRFHVSDQSRQHKAVSVKNCVLGGLLALRTQGMAVVNALCCGAFPRAHCRAGLARDRAKGAAHPRALPAAQHGHQLRAGVVHRAAALTGWNALA